jgi:class 3 adenylate cyclase/tetratricopeptide (TPR) repeat protein
MQSTTCPNCNTDNRPAARFCDACGVELRLSSRRLEAAATSDTQQAQVSKGDRRQATVLFCDLAGYTSLSEALDPEEVKDLLGGFFAVSREVIHRYQGTVEKYIGDAVMSVFGVPEVHEDDAVRAVRAAIEIQERVEGLSASMIHGDVTRPLATHCGINTGLVVTSGSDRAQGSVGVVGDTVNVASRLCALAKPGEILVGDITRSLTERHFSFEERPPTQLKGKTKARSCHRVIAPRELPIRTHRFAGRRTALVGRSRELGCLEEAHERVKNGQFSAVLVCGEAGSGKSRLIEEYRKLQGPDTFHWCEGQANDYAHGIPYHPIVDLLGRAWGIHRDDPPDRVRRTIETRVTELVEEPSEAIPYVLSLYALEHPELTGISPEYWKRRLFAAAQVVFQAMARRGPSVFFFEDLHWADPSTLELVQHLIDALGVPAIILCTSRLPFRDLGLRQRNGKSNGAARGPTIDEIVLEPLAPVETEALTRGLLEGDEAPRELFDFMQEKTEGNPFYVEEVLNSLIEDGLLERAEDRWGLTKPLAEFDVPPTVEEVIAARLDRQNPDSRRLLQEASVIGRTFLPLILREITECREGIEDRLSALVASDLIRPIDLEPDIAYGFKHALTHEVAYGSLLRSERAVIHVRVAQVMERLLADRLPEFFEILAFHFKHGGDVNNATKYLIKSGEKAVNHFALEEAREHFRQAYHSLKESDETEEQRELQAHLLETWAAVFYYYGDFRDLLQLFGTHGALVQSVKDKSRRGMLTAWSGMAHFFRNHPEKAYRTLMKALAIGEEIADARVIAYASTWLAMVCGGLARFEEGITHGERAQRIAQTMPEQHYLHFKSLGMLGFNYVMMGEAAKTHQMAEKLMEFGERNPRSLFFGYWMRAEGYSLAGNAAAAMEAAEHGLRVLKDPFYLGFARAVHGMKCLAVGQQSSSLDIALEQAVEQGSEFMVNWWKGFVGLGRVLQGQTDEGMRLIEEASRGCSANGDVLFHQVNEYLKAKVYLQMFLAGYQLPAEERATALLTSAIEYWRQVGARGWLAQALLDLGLLHQAKNRRRDARACWTEAADLFEKVGADMYLEQVRGLLERAAA